MGLSGLALLLLNKARVRLGLLDVSQGIGTANTAMIAHAGRIMALNEGVRVIGSFPCDMLLHCIDTCRGVIQVRTPAASWRLMRG